MRAPLLALALLLPGPMTAAPGDYWHVDQWSTNVRLGPGTDHGIARQLGEGDVVMELDRHDDWLYVVLDRKGATGWLYQGLATPLSGTESTADVTDWYALFHELLENEADERRSNGEPVLFPGSRYQGYATVKIHVSDAFLALSREDQLRELDALTRLWQTIDNTGIPGSVILATEDGERLVVSSGLRGRHWLED